MANSAKRKGDRAELEVQGMIRDHLGIPARRALGAGRKDDIGDIHGVPHTVVQVVNWKNIAAAVKAKPNECEQQRERAEMPFGATFVRLKGTEDGEPAFRVVMTPKQFFAMYRECL